MLNDKRFWTTIGGSLLAAAGFLAMRTAGMDHAKCWTAAVTILCAIWWLCESLPLAATSLVPFAVFPLAGVLDESDVAAAYGHPLVLLFLGGFMLSRAAERSGAHRRIADVILQLVGAASDRRIVFGFMVATALSSMWISNTATALMMLPVALAVLERDASGRLGMPLMLGVGYSATIGGMATPIGSPPNGVCIAVYETLTGHQITFPEWMAIGLVVAIVMLIVAWLVLTLRLSGAGGIEMPASDGWTSAQRRTLVVFGLAALGWITRDVPFGGWSAILNIETAGDSTVALLAALGLFLIPSGEAPGERLLDWQTAATIPWGILILFGGGIAIAAAFESSGLSEAIGERLSGIGDWPPVSSIGAVCLGATFFSEVASNTASATVLLPVLGAAAEAASVAPAMLMIPAGLAVSCGFMLPVATPPNAIVFGSGHVKMADMARVGLVLNLVGSLVITLVCWKLVPLVFAGG
jgi:solute carrier family 13 (sodium-dependent dicarboxylate transporter), member 2/3/5